MRRDAAAGAVPGLAITGAGALRLAQSGPRWGRRPSVAVESVESGAVVSVDSVAEALVAAGARVSGGGGDD